MAKFISFMLSQIQGNSSETRGESPNFTDEGKINIQPGVLRNFGKYLGKNIAIFAPSKNM